MNNNTPTDDEREALADALEWHITSREVRDSIADAILAAGFRRTEVPEPSAEGPAFIALMPPSPETSKRWYSMYCRVCGIEEMMADAADAPRLLARRDEHNRERHAEPQGEPSDAQVDAMQEILYDDYREGDRDVIRRAWRSALRAAGDVR